MSPYSAGTSRSTPRRFTSSWRHRAWKPHDPGRKCVRPLPPRTRPGTRVWSSGTPAATRPGMKWVGDITYIRTWEWFICLATLLGCCTKKAIEYAMLDHMRSCLVCDAIDMAVRNCLRERETPVFHSDRGCQYTSDTPTTSGILASVGRTGICWDNACTESAGVTLKNERDYQMVSPTRDKATMDNISWIEPEHTVIHNSTHPQDTGPQQDKAGTTPHKTINLKTDLHPRPQNTKQLISRGAHPVVLSCAT